MNSRLRVAAAVAGAGFVLTVGMQVASASNAYPPTPPKSDSTPPVIQTDPQASTPVTSSLPMTGFQADDAAAIGIALLAGGAVVTIAGRRKARV